MLSEFLMLEYHQDLRKLIRAASPRSPTVDSRLLGLKWARWSWQQSHTGLKTVVERSFTGFQEMMAKTR